MNNWNIFIDFKILLFTFFKIKSKKLTNLDWISCYGSNKIPWLNLGIVFYLYF